MKPGRVKVYLVKAFGRGRAGGNAAGVVLDAGGLTAAQKQDIARKIGYSETAFVGDSGRADFRVDFFTPVKRIPNCGHATVAAFALLRRKKIAREDEATVETLNGIGRIRFEGNRVFMEQRPVGSWGVTRSQERELLKSLGLSRPRLLRGFAPRLVSTGNNFFLLGVDGTESLRGLRPDFQRIAALSAKRRAVGYYVFALVAGGRCAATTRMFAPFFGIDEESATGMAAGPLAWMLHDELGVSRGEFQIEQGRFMRRPSPSTILARVSAVGGKVKSLLIGGQGFVASETSVPLG